MPSSLDSLPCKKHMWSLTRKVRHSRHSRRKIWGIEMKPSNGFCPFFRLGGFEKLERTESPSQLLLQASALETLAFRPIVQPTLGSFSPSSVFSSSPRSCSLGLLPQFLIHFFWSIFQNTHFQRTDPSAFQPREVHASPKDLPSGLHWTPVQWKAQTQQLRTQLYAF